MSMLAQPTPPLLLHLQPTALSVLESFVGGADVRLAPDSPDRLIQSLLVEPPKGQPADDYNSFALAQYVMVLYIRVFVSPASSMIYTSILSNVISTIIAAHDARKITDRALAAFVRRYLIDRTEVQRGRAFIDALDVVYARLRPEAAHPGIDNLMPLIQVVYDSRDIVAESVPLYQVMLRQVEGYTQPTLVMAPLRSCRLTTALYADIPDLYWKFVLSLDIPGNLREPGDFTSSIYLLAQLALPLDPIELNTALYQDLTNNAKSGVPFANYLAMYLKQREIGFDYQLSRLANGRRRLMDSLHRFCGVGATCIVDIQLVRYLCAMVSAVFDNDETLISELDAAILAHIKDAINRNTRTPFARMFSGNEALETLKAKQDKKNDKDKKDKDKKTPPADPKKPDTGEEEEDGEDQEEDVGAFAGDKDRPDPNLTLPTNTDAIPSNTPENVDNNIDQTGGGQTPAAQPVSTFLPLALPSETIDDHLYRLTVLAYVSQINQTTNPDIPSDTLNVMRAWCDSWLFLAAATTTKKLMAQLKLAEHLKEFAA